MDRNKFIKKTLQSIDSTKPITYLKALKEFSNYEGVWNKEITIHVLRNYSIEPIELYLQLYLYSHNLKATITYSDYDAYQQEIIDPRSKLQQEKHDFVILSLIPDNIKLAEYFDHNAVSEATDEVVDHMKWLVESLNKSLTHGQLITIGLPPHFYGANGPDFNATSNINKSLKNICSSNNTLYIDIENIFSSLGWQSGFDGRTWMMQKAPWTSQFNRHLAKDLAQSIAISRGNIKKLIVLDCDNTLWGGILGEDGAEGVELSQTEYPGTAFYSVQKILLDLHDKGALLALCSKNNECDVLNFLKEHPDNLIKEHHLVSWRINWKNKAENILDLADELNISTDSFIFIDDSSVECELITEALPEVTTIQVPQQISEYPNQIMAIGHFNGPKSNEDRNKTEKYKTEQKRKSTQHSYSNIDDFIKSLNIKVEVGVPSSSEFTRVAQLTHKTNQFNLTTIRYSESDIGRLVEASNSFVLKLRAEDKFGDYGLTGVAIIRREDDYALIDSLMLSCRVLGRKIENSFVNAIIIAIQKRWKEVTQIRATYIATRKNTQVDCFWEKMGFSLVSHSSNSKDYMASIDGLNYQNENVADLTLL